jgi:hypothetical protein
MKKLILIALVVIAIIGVVIVDTMAGPSDSSLINSDSEQQIAAETNSAYNPLDNTNDFSEMNSKGASTTELLSISMIGLTLVGLAGFKEGRHTRRN